MNSTLAGGFNPSEKYESNWIISPGRDENKKMKPPCSTLQRQALFSLHVFLFHQPMAPVSKLAVVGLWPHIYVGQHFFRWQNDVGDGFAKPVHGFGGLKKKHFGKYILVKLDQFH